MARVLTRHGNRVGAMLYGTRVDTVLPPRLSRLHVLNLMRLMRSASHNCRRACSRIVSPTMRLSSRP